MELKLAIILVCFAVQFLAMMGYLIFGLPRVPRVRGQATNNV